MDRNTKKSRFKKIKLNKIKPNPDNPRRDLKFDEDFDNLSKSILEYGILNPLVVVEIEDEDYDYMLIDGFRRYNAAKKVMLDEAPATIITMDVLERSSILDWMFQIHMNRKEWNPMEQALAVNNIIKEIERENGGEALFDISSDICEKEMVNKVAKRFNMSKARAEDILQFLSWPSDIIDEVRYADKRWFSYIIEIEEKIIEPAYKHYPEFFTDIITVNEARTALFEKVKVTNLERARDIRDSSIIVKNIKSGKDKDKVLNILKEFILDRSYGFTEVGDDYVAIFPFEKPAEKLTYRKFINRIEKFRKYVDDFDFDVLETIKKETIFSRLSKLTDRIRRIISFDAGKE